MTQFQLQQARDNVTRDAIANTLAARDRATLRLTVPRLPMLSTNRFRDVYLFDKRRDGIGAMLSLWASGIATIRLDGGSFIKCDTYSEAFTILHNACA